MTCLVIPQTKVSKQTVVLQYICSKLLHFGQIFEMQVPLQEPLVELYYLAEREMLTRRLV